ncbi:hypothetical protein LY76DRAFT_85620 [Colletotrichum caudatum]|nr:hypothetical protein LY76DRAFT_85620 [Colletotrichum caudatum]
MYYLNFIQVHRLLTDGTTYLDGVNRADSNVFRWPAGTSINVAVLLTPSEGGRRAVATPSLPRKSDKMAWCQRRGARDFLLADERQKHTDRQVATAHPMNGRNDDSWRLKGQKPGPCRRDERYPSVSGLLGQGVWSQQPVALGSISEPPALTGV